jgi:hypothetical protein
VDRRCVAAVLAWRAAACAAAAVQVHAGSQVEEHA